MDSRLATPEYQKEILDWIDAEAKLYDEQGLSADYEQSCKLEAAARLIRYLIADGKIVRQREEMLHKIEGSLREQADVDKDFIEQYQQQVRSLRKLVIDAEEILSAIGNDSFDVRVWRQEAAAHFEDLGNG